MGLMRWDIRHLEGLLLYGPHSWEETSQQVSHGAGWVCACDALGHHLMGWRGPAGRVLKAHAMRKGSVAAVVEGSSQSLLEPPLCFSTFHKYERLESDTCSGEHFGHRPVFKLDSRTCQL